MRGPVLILQGARDARVQLNQSTRMAEALKQAGKPVDFVLFPNAGHNLYRWTDWSCPNSPDTLTFLNKVTGFNDIGIQFFNTQVPFKFVG